jgi:tryptophanyl-tRNA synthetase
MIEQTNEIVRCLARLADRDVLPECRALLSSTPRLPGIDGRKASKSLGNAIPLSATPEEVRAKVRAMYTDQNHLRASDPVRVEGNVVFAHLRAFDPDQAAVADLEERYRRGGLGDAALKQRLETVLETLLAPIRERRAEAARQPRLVEDLIHGGSAQARWMAAEVLEEVRSVFALGG